MISAGEPRAIMRPPRRAMTSSQNRAAIWMSCNTIRMRHQHRQPNPLPFSSGQSVHQTIRQSGDAGQIHRCLDLSAILAGKAAKRAVPGIAPDRHQFADPKTGGRGKLLRQIGQFAREFPIAPFGKRPVHETQLSRAWLLLAREDFHEGGFSRSRRTSPRWQRQGGCRPAWSGSDGHSCLQAFPSG